MIRKDINLQLLLVILFSKHADMMEIHRHTNLLNIVHLRPEY